MIQAASWLATEGESALQEAIVTASCINAALWLEQISGAASANLISLVESIIRVRVQQPHPTSLLERSQKHEHFHSAPWRLTHTLALRLFPPRDRRAMDRRLPKNGRQRQRTCTGCMYGKATGNTSACVGKPPWPVRSLSTDFCVSWPCTPQPETQPSPRAGPAS